MSQRAGLDWAPLDLKEDPVPGDPEQVRHEEHHLKAVARQVEDQIKVLRRIGSSHDEKGEHAEKMRDAARELAEQLEKVKGRYRKVASALRGWAPELEHAQKTSLTALHHAAGPHETLRRLGGLEKGPDWPGLAHGWPHDPGPGLRGDPEELRKQKADERTIKHAQGELAAAHRLLKQATDLRDTQASHCAKLIRHACDDDVKDSTWDGFKNWVAKNSWWIKDVCLALEAIAFIAAIVALACSGGWVILGLALSAEGLMAASVGLTAVALIGRAILASTGNGSWSDVAWDAIGVLGFKGTGAITKALSGVVENMGDMAKAAGALSTDLPVWAKEAEVGAKEFRVLGSGDRGIANLTKSVMALGGEYGDVPGMTEQMLKGVALSKLGKDVAYGTLVLTGGPLVAGGLTVEGPGLDHNAEEAGQHESFLVPFVPGGHQWMENHFGKPFETEGGVSDGVGPMPIYGSLAVAASLL